MKSKKFLINLQFSPHDKAVMMGLCRLIADLQPRGEPLADILLSPRFDAEADSDAITALSRKFKVMVRKTEVKAKGWPAGCNAMALDSYGWFVDQCESGGMDYCAMFFGEADCVPLQPNWIELLSEEWHKCDWNWHLGNKQLILGPWCSRQETKITHINGNCLISPFFRRVCPEFNPKGCSATWGWDAYYAEKMLRFGRPSRLLYSDYHLDTPRNPWPPGAGPEHLFKSRVFAPDNPLHGQTITPVYLHGVKTLRGQEIVRQKFL